MEEPKFFKFFCRFCRTKIKFPSRGVGEKIKCPGCGKEIILENPSSNGSTGLERNWTMLAGIFGVVILFVTIIAIKSRDAHNSIGKSEVIPSADSSRKADVPKIEINAISDTSFCKIEGKDGEAWWLQGDFKKISINHQGNFEDQKRHNYEYPSFSVDRNDINKLIAALSKSLEWSKIAKTNDVEPFNKVITPFDEHEEAIFIHANEEDSIYFHYRIGANVEWAKNLNQEKSSLDAQFTCSDVEKLLGLFSQIPEMDKALIVKNNKAAKDAEKFK